MHAHKRILIITLLGYLINCATVGKRFDYKNEIEIGKTDKAAIEKLLGQPFQRGETTKNGLTSEYFLYYAFLASANFSKELFVEFVNGKVNSYNFVADWDGESTDFPYQKHKEININKSKTEDVLRLLGKPGGVIRFPTNFLTGERYNVAKEKKTKTIFHYAFAQMKEQGSRVQRLEKHVQILFDENGTAVDLHAQNEIP